MVAYRKPIYESRTPDHNVNGFQLDSSKSRPYRDKDEDEDEDADTLALNDEAALLNGTRSSGLRVGSQTTRTKPWTRYAIGGVILALLAGAGYQHYAAQPNYEASYVNKAELKADGARWVVLTTINYATDSVRTLATIPDLNVVVVGDTKTPKDWSSPGVHFLSVERQKKINHRIFSRIPYRHYGRKNFGYLFALANGARTIYGTDDDNELIDGLNGFDLVEPVTPPVIWQLLDSRDQDNKTEPWSRNVCNPYAAFGQPSVWPRGYPLQNIADAPCSTFRKAPVRNYIQQGLANGDPDVDAIFRLTRKDSREDIRVHFNSKVPSIAYPYGMFSPFNSQNTLFHYPALPLMYIPVTTTFRVCDIWRGYWAQRLLWEIGGQLTFQIPSVRQFRNAHDYLDDYLDERDLYEQAHGLIDFLSAWRSTKPTFLERIVDLAQGMARGGFWDKAEAVTIAHWVEDLRAVGYVEPPLYDWEAEMREPSVLTGEGWYQRDDGSRLPVFDFLPAQQPSIYLSDTVRPAQLASLPYNGAMDGCPLADVEIRIAAVWRDQYMLEVMTDSWKAAMPCFPPFHLIVPNHEVQNFTMWAERRGLPNFHVHPENVPAGVKYQAWYPDFFSDKIGTSPYIFSLDTDVIMTAPFACNSLFDDDGKPYSIFWVDLVVRFPSTLDILLRAKRNFPDKWNYTEQQAIDMQGWNWMSYFPMVHPRFIYATMREVISDAYGGIDFTEAYKQLDMISQFDLGGHLAYLLYPEYYHFIPVPSAQEAFEGPNVDRYRDGHQHMLAAVHLNYPHIAAPEGSWPVLQEYPNADWINYTAQYAKRLICTRDSLSRPINHFPSAGLMSNVLEGWDGDCSASPDLVYPYKELMLYTEHLTHYDGEVWKQRYLASLDADRALCSDPIRRRVVA